MGQAKERKARLGKWYGKPIGPGHPDFVPPKKPVAATETTQEEPTHPEATRALSGIDEAREDEPGVSQTASRRLPGLFAFATLGMIAASGIDLGPVPSPRPKKR